MLIVVCIWVLVSMINFMHGKGEYETSMFKVHVFSWKRPLAEILNESKFIICAKY